LTANIRYSRFSSVAFPEERSDARGQTDPLPRGTRAAPGVRVLRRDDAKVLASHDGGFTSRALFPFDEPRLVEFHELRLEPRSQELADPPTPT
jgi:hypothetical protein